MILWYSPPLLGLLLIGCLRLAVEKRGKLSERKFGLVSLLGASSLLCLVLSDSTSTHAMVWGSVLAIVASSCIFKAVADTENEMNMRCLVPTGGIPLSTALLSYPPGRQGQVATNQSQQVRQGYNGAYYPPNYYPYRNQPQPQYWSRQPQSTHVPTQLRFSLPVAMNPTVFAAQNAAAPDNGDGPQDYVIYAGCEGKTDLNENELLTMDQVQMNAGTSDNPYMVNVVVKVPKSCFPIPDNSRLQQLLVGGDVDAPSPDDAAGNKGDDQDTNFDQGDEPAPEYDDATTKALQTLGVSSCAGLQVWNLLIFLNFASLWIIATINFLYLRQSSDQTSPYGRTTVNVPPMPFYPPINVGPCSDVAGKLAQILKPPSWE